MTSYNSNTELLLGDIKPQNYKMTNEDVIPYYVYAEILSGCLNGKVVHRHYKVNNEFVRKYAFRFNSSIPSESQWITPGDFREDGILLIGGMELPGRESYGTLAVTMMDSNEKQCYYICNQQMVYSLVLAGDILIKNCAIIEMIYCMNGIEKIVFSLFFTKNEGKLALVKGMDGCIRFSDVDCVLSYRVVSAYEYISFDKREYSRRFFDNKIILSDFIRTLAEYISPTEGLKKLDKRAVELFNELYHGDDPITLGERKLFFREMAASSGALSYTQSGSDFLLKKLKELCKKLDIRYWLYYGTLLGAKRHGGFIPWDDDIDVGLMRADIMRLQEYLINDPYFTVDVLYNTEWADRVYKFRFKGDYLPVYVDLFAFDYCKGDSSVIWDNLKKIKSEMVKRFREEEQRSGCVYRRTFDVPASQLKKINKMFDSFGQEAKKLLGIVDYKTDKIVYGYDNVFLSDWLQVFSLSDIEPFEKATFNGTDHSVFKNGEDVLVMNYKAPYTLPNDVVSHRHTVRMSAGSISRLEKLMTDLKDYKF